MSEKKITGPLSDEPVREYRTDGGQFEPVEPVASRKAPAPDPDAWQKFERRNARITAVEILEEAADAVELLADIDEGENVDVDRLREVARVLRGR